MNSAFTFLGVPVLENPNLTEAGEPVTVRRSWRARLFTRPWRPWAATRQFTPQVPYRGVLWTRIGGVSHIICHPATAATLRGLTNREVATVLNEAVRS